MVDTFVTDYGYANRSEFFRAILRLVFRNPEVITKAEDALLLSPTTYNTSKIVSEFSKSKKYSKEFLNDLEMGLKESPNFIDL